MNEFNKFLTKDMLVKDVDFSDWPGLVRLYKKRVVEWYFEPLNDLGPHGAYVALLTLCNLTTMFAKWSDLTVRDFLMRLDPAFGETVVDKQVAAIFREEVILQLRETFSLGPNAGMSGTGQLVTIVGKVRPIVVFDPSVLRTKLLSWFEDTCGYVTIKPHSATARSLRNCLSDMLQVTIPEVN